MARTRSARRMNAADTGWSGWAATIGVPASIQARSAGTSGMSASSSAPSASASRRPPPRPKIAPHDVLQELPDDAHHHRPAPDDGRAVVEEKTHRHQCHAVALDRQDPFAFADLRPRLRNAHHERYARTVDVRVDQADARARAP